MGEATEEILGYFLSLFVIWNESGEVTLLQADEMEVKKRLSVEGIIKNS